MYVYFNKSCVLSLFFVARLIKSVGECSDMIFWRQERHVETVSVAPIQ